MEFKTMLMTIDAHVSGEAYRILVNPSILFNGISIEENHRVMLNDFEQERKLLLREPRGHKGIKGCIVIASKIADFSLLFLSPDDTSDTFSYSGIIASLAALLETNMIPKNKDDLYEVETIYGILKVYAKLNQQSGIDFTIETKKWELVKKNDSYSIVRDQLNRKYFLFPLPSKFNSIHLDNVMELRNWGVEKINDLFSEHKRLDELVIFKRVGNSPQHFRTITFTHDGNIIRSAGIESTFALHMNSYTENNFKKNNKIKNENIVGNTFVSTKKKNKFVLSGRSFIYGLQQLIYDETDPFPEGFLLK